MRSANVYFLEIKNRGGCGRKYCNEMRSSDGHVPGEAVKGGPEKGAGNLDH